MGSWSKIEFIFAHRLHISPLDLRELEFYSIQYILKEYEDYVDKENKEYEKQNKELERQQKSMKMPQQGFGNYSMPKFDTPKFDIPKY